MPRKKITAYCCLAFLLCCTTCYGQSIDSVTGKIANFPARLFSRIQNKTTDLNQRLTKQTEKYLQKMAKQEERLKKQLSAVDSNSAKTLFATSQQQYAALAQRLKTDTGNRATSLSGEYRPFTDSLRGTLAFLKQNPQLLGSGEGLGKNISPETLIQLQGATSQLQALQAKMQDADQISQFLAQRKAQMGQYLSKYDQLPSSLTNSYSGYTQQLYYYKQQVNEYEDMLNDPDKLFRSALSLLNKLPAYTSFMKNNSALSSLFNIPNVPGANDPAATAGLPAGGLQARDQVVSVLQGQMGTANSNATALTQQNVSSAQGQVDQLRDKLTSGGGGDLNMPDFKPNGQKTRSFLKRLEFGTNFQTTQSSYFFPTTTDIAVSLGYRITDNNDIGIGASYKIGWGSDIQHIQVTSQGVGLRSFLDIQLKKSLYASGGFEYNYQQPFTLQGFPYSLDNWQKSGLIGLSKVISMKNGVLKNTKIQLLWDFLSYQQVPKTPPIKFRLGYTF